MALLPSIPVKKNGYRRMIKTGIAVKVMEKVIFPSMLPFRLRNLYRRVYEGFDIGTELQINIQNISHFDIFPVVPEIRRGWYKKSQGYTITE